MNKVIQPFGKLAREIVIKADVNGLVIVEAAKIEAMPIQEQKRGFRPLTIVKEVRVPMDAREMVLALIKVVQDYTAVIFAHIGEGVVNHGETNQDNHSPGTNGGAGNGNPPA